MKLFRRLLHPSLVAGVLLLPLLSTAAAATVDVLIEGSGGGAIISDPPGIACLANPCRCDFPAGTAITFYAVPEAASTFTGWGGACSGTGICEAGIDISDDGRAVGLTPITGLRLT